MEAVESTPQLLGVLFTAWRLPDIYFLCLLLSADISQMCTVPCQAHMFLSLHRGQASWQASGMGQVHRTCSAQGLTDTCWHSVTSHDGLCLIAKTILKDILLCCGRTLQSSQSQGKYCSICRASLEICLICNESCFIPVAGR